MDGKAYLASLNDGRRVYWRGKRIDNVAEHPLLKELIARVAASYDHFTRHPEERDAFLAPATTVEEMRSRSKQPVDGLTHTTLTSLMALLTAAERVAPVRPQVLQAVTDYVAQARARDWRIAECISDAKGDRSRAPAQQGDRDAYVRVVGRRGDGVIIRGAKLHISMAAVAHELMVIPTKAMKPDEGEYAIACMVPVNAPGVSIVDVGNGEPPAAADPRDFPFGKKSTISQGFVIFDDVFVPEERVFLDGETKLAATFAHSLGLWVRASTMAHTCDELDRMVGFAQLIVTRGRYDMARAKQMALGSIGLSEPQGDP